MTLKNRNPFSMAREVSPAPNLKDRECSGRPSVKSATPGRCAEALARFVDDQTVPILDFGCNDGYSGLSLKLAGFATIDGVDTSQEMVATALSRHVYRNVTQMVGDPPLMHTPGTYGAIAATGPVTGVARQSMVHTLMRGMNRGAKLVFSFTDDDLQNPSNEAGLNEWLDCGAAVLLFKEHGIHRPEVNINSNVYVVEKY